MAITAVSHGLAACAFLLLAIMLFAHSRARILAKVLVVACAATAIWAAATFSYAIYGRDTWLVLSEAAETLRTILWILFCVMLAERPTSAASYNTWQRKKFTLIVGVAILIILAGASVYGYGQAEAPTRHELLVQFVGRMVAAVAGMVLVEQFYRSQQPHTRWAVKFGCLAIGGMFAFDFYLYSDAALFLSLDERIWAARGAVNALAVPLIAVSATRTQGWSTGIAVSRAMVLHSATLLGSALYLLIIAAAGYYIRWFGGTWGTVLQTTLLCAGIVALMVVLLSGSARAWTKVFISKHFFSYRYDYRKEWLRFTQALSSDGPGLGERAIQAIAHLVESPAGVLYMRNEEHDAFILHSNWNISCAKIAEPIHGNLCQFLEKKQWVINVEEYRIYPERYDGLLLPRWLCAMEKVWVLVPLLTGSRLVGFVMLTHPRSPVILNWETTDLLKVAARQAASFLAQQETAAALVVARQFESYNRMSTFIVHDLKNLISQLTLLISNAERHRHNREFQDDMLDTLANSVQKMNLLLQKLKSDGDNFQGTTPTRLDMLLERVINGKVFCQPKPELSLESDEAIVLANKDRLERVLGHLVQNAVEATPASGQVRARLYLHNDHAVVDIQDSGCGMSQEFLETRLFKPFQSTKSAGMGIGVFESHSYISEIGGEIGVFSRPLEGTLFQVRLPLHRQTAKPSAYSVIKENTCES